MELTPNQLDRLRLAFHEATRRYSPNGPEYHAWFAKEVQRALDELGLAIVPVISATPEPERAGHNVTSTDT